MSSESTPELLEKITENARSLSLIKALQLYPDGWLNRAAG